MGGGDAAREKVHAAQRGREREEGAVVGVEQKRKRGGQEVAEEAAAVEEKTDGAEVGTKVDGGDDWHGGVEGGRLLK